ncbi:MAG: hypothetical protein ABIP79_07940, partial [Chitinophagaceae bacterium]
FFIFKKADIPQEVAMTKETTGKDVSSTTKTTTANAGDIDKEIKEVNSDERVVTDEVKPKGNAVPPPMEATLADQEMSNNQGYLKQTTEGLSATIEKEKDLDVKRADKSVSYNDDNVNLDNLKVQEEQVLEEKSKVTPTVTLAATSTGSTYYNTTPVNTVNTNGTTNNSTNNTAFSKSTTVDDGVKGKKKEAKKEDYNYKYKSTENVPADNKNKATTTLTTPAGPVNGEVENTGNNTIVTADNTVRTGNGAGVAETTVAEAEFIGGKTALDSYIKKNLVIPASCPDEEIVIIRFTIDESGNVSKPKILSKTGNCSDCEKEAIRFVKAMPAWIAATTQGKAFNSQKTLVLSFKK